MIQYSIGELIDKLTIVNLKLWHTEEQIGILKEKKASLDQIEPLCDRVVSFNSQRNEIVESINEFFDKR